MRAACADEGSPRKKRESRHSIRAVVHSGGSFARACSRTTSAQDDGYKEVVVVTFSVKELFLIMTLHPLATPSSSWIYILTNQHNTTLYVGVTTNLRTRLWEHRTKRDPKSFTARYNLYKLVYYEGFDSVLDAIDREKFIKGKTRKWKETLIQKLNPDWNDLTSLFDD